MMTSPDRIEREIFIEAPMDRVWAVLTEPELVGVWFGQGTPTQIDLRPGGTMTLHHGGEMVFPTLIVAVEPPRYFAYRWAAAHPGVQATESNSTLVEFTLTAEPDGTRLQLSESGFATLEIPDGREWHASHGSHSAGWTEKLADLALAAQQ